MPRRSRNEVLNLKLGSIPVSGLREIAEIFGVSSRGAACDIIKRLLEKRPDEHQIDHFIKQKYAEQIGQRRRIISDEALKEELNKVKFFPGELCKGNSIRKYNGNL